MTRFLFACTIVGFFVISNVCSAQVNRDRSQDIPERYVFVPRNLSQAGDYKWVVVPATNARQARLDAQTYHIGWNAIAAQEGQSRVMYEVLLQKRPTRLPGTPPVTRPIPRDQPVRR